VKITQEELVATVRKAFEGLGFPPGEREDAADMVVWLELHGMGGLSELRKGLRYLRDEATQRPEQRYADERLAVLDARGASVLAVGAHAAETACTMARSSGIATVRIADCHNRLLVLGYLNRAARQGVNLLAYWENRGDEPVIYSVSITAGDELPSVRAYDVVGEDLSHTHDLVLIASTDFMLAPFPYSERLIDRPRLSPTPEFMRTHMERCFGEGMDVDDPLWAEIRELAVGA
jgi:hypothetical protein